MNFTQIRKKIKKAFDLVRTSSSFRTKVEQNISQTINLNGYIPQIKILKREIHFLRSEIAGNGSKIRVLFICHSPSVWGKISAIYEELTKSPRFEPIVIAVPHKHSAYKEGVYKDGGMRECLDLAGIPYLWGCNEKTGQWVDIQSLRPDYVFYQTPYRLFPSSYLASAVSLYAKICYVPYVGILIYKGVVDDISQPLYFFKYLRFGFMPNGYEADALLNKHQHLCSDEIVVAGSPMFEHRSPIDQSAQGEWKLPHKEAPLRVLWTPRWRTVENNCHFFEYKDKLLSFAKQNPEVELLFRPHPLTFSNFQKTGEFTKKELDDYRNSYRELSNASIDESGDYTATIAGSDVLVTDMSSLMAEYMQTGKPIVYTHRTHSFNEVGEILSKGFYWAESYAELKEILEMLGTGEDPLRNQREKIIKDIFFVPEGGASKFIARSLESGYGVHNAIGGIYSDTTSGN